MGVSKLLTRSVRRDADLSPSRLRRKKYLNSALLIIDEMGFEPLSRQEASLFFRLVSDRYERGSILITTNKGIRDWPDVLAGDEVLATAILDRLLHRSHVLNIRDAATGCGNWNRRSRRPRDRAGRNTRCTLTKGETAQPASRVAVNWRTGA